MPVQKYLDTSPYKENTREILTIPNNMTSKPENIHPTEPGPFQKYLFSGACYVQIGQCYQLAKQSADDHTELRDNDGFATPLNAIWTNFLLQQTASLAVLESDFGLAETNTHNPATDELLALIRNTGHAAISHFLEAMELTNPKDMNTRQFFMLWATSCDKAYATLIRSKLFTKFLGDSVNRILHITSTQTGDNPTDADNRQ